MNSVLYVSKALSPPWNDSGKNLVRDLAEAAPRHGIEVFAGPGFEPESPRVRVRKRLGESAYAPGLAQKASIFGSLLLLPPRISLVHFFFAPNPATSRMAGIALRLHRRPSVRSPSSPALRGRGALSAGDRRGALGIQSKRSRMRASGTS
jgi:hypothetical protein